MNTDIPYSTALGLLDVKEELSQSLVFRSKKSSKPALAEDRMKRLMRMCI